MGSPLDEIDAEAEQVEHAISDTFVDGMGSLVNTPVTTWTAACSVVTVGLNLCLLYATFAPSLGSGCLIIGGADKELHSL